MKLGQRPVVVEANGVTPAAFSLSALAMNSSQVVGGVISFSAKTFLL